LKVAPTYAAIVVEEKAAVQQLTITRSSENNSM
jgi:hypothetical protein